MFRSLLNLMGVSERDDLPKFTWEEVALHNTMSSLWIVMGNHVYDITPLLGMHPGGDKSLLRRGGGVDDCTADFNFHSRTGRNKWDIYRIGSVIGRREDSVAFQKQDVQPTAVSTSTRTPTVSVSTSATSTSQSHGLPATQMPTGMMKKSAPVNDARRIASPNGPQNMVFHQPDLYERVTYCS